MGWNVGGVRVGEKEEEAEEWEPQPKLRAEDVFIFLEAKHVETGQILGSWSKDLTSWRKDRDEGGWTEDSDNDEDEWALEVVYDVHDTEEEDL